MKSRARKNLPLLPWIAAASVGCSMLMLWTAGRGPGGGGSPQAVRTGDAGALEREPEAAPADDAIPEMTVEDPPAEVAEEEAAADETAVGSEMPERVAAPGPTPFAGPPEPPAAAPVPEPATAPASALAPGPGTVSGKTLPPREKWPKEVRLLRAARFPLVRDGAEVGAVSVPPGTLAKLEEIGDGGVKVSVVGRTAWVEAEATDLAERMEPPVPVAPPAQTGGPAPGVEATGEATVIFLAAGLGASPGKGTEADPFLDVAPAKLAALEALGKGGSVEVRVGAGTFEFGDWRSGGKGALKVAGAGYSTRIASLEADAARVEIREVALKRLRVAGREAVLSNMWAGELRVDAKSAASESCVFGMGEELPVEVGAGAENVLFTDCAVLQVGKGVPPLLLSAGSGTALGFENTVFFHAGGRDAFSLGGTAMGFRDFLLAVQESRSDWSRQRAERAFDPWKEEP